MAFYIWLKIRWHKNKWRVDFHFTSLTHQKKVENQKLDINYSNSNWPRQREWSICIHLVSDICNTIINITFYISFHHFLWRSFSSFCVEISGVKIFTHKKNAAQFSGIFQPLFYAFLLLFIALIWFALLTLSLLSLFSY